MLINCLVRLKPGSRTSVVKGKTVSATAGKAKGLSGPIEDSKNNPLLVTPKKKASAPYVLISRVFVVDGKLMYLYRDSDLEGTPYVLYLISCTLTDIVQFV